jgi:hypothetical protein
MTQSGATKAFLAMAFASFFADGFPEFAGGAPLAFSFCVAAACCRNFLSEYAVPILFKPDVMAVADPLAPSEAAGVMARGVQAAFAMSDAKQRPVRLLVARVPGYDAELRVNAAAARVEADLWQERRRERGNFLFAKNPQKNSPARASRAPISSSKYTLRQSGAPELSPGLEPAVFELRGAGGSNMLLVANPGRAWRAAAPSAAAVLATQAALFAAAAFLMDAEIAAACVLPSACAEAFHRGKTLRFQTPARIGATSAFAVAIAIINLTRFALL